jgi:tetratricopeptide (TPR) repeat protein
MIGRVLLGAFVAAIAAWVSVAAFGHAVAQGDPRNRCLDGGARPDETVAACNDAINRYPNDAVLWNSRAVEREKQGRLDSALANLNTAIRLKPDYGLAYANRGRIYVQKGDYAHALRDLDEAIRLSPKHSEALYLRGTAKEKLGDVRNALDDYEKAAQLNPSYEEASAQALRSLPPQTPIPVRTRRAASIWTSATQAEFPHARTRSRNRPGTRTCGIRSATDISGKGSTIAPSPTIARL